MSAYVVGRSSWGRLGLVVATAVYVHPGFHGCLTLELVNEGDSPICLTPGSRVAQLAVHRLQSPAPAREDEGEKYYAPVRPQASRLSGERQEFVDLRRLGAFVEGVAALRQTLRAHQSGAERLLVHATAHGETTHQPLPACLQQLRDPASVEALLAGAGPHLLPPRVGIKAVLLALPGRERRVLGRAL